MQGKPFIHSLRLQNLLSYGPEGEEIKLQPLNVVIGPNGSGKSNLIAAVDLLHSVPSDFTTMMSRTGGIEEWLWKGAQDIPTATIEAALHYTPIPEPLKYRLAFTGVGQSTQIVQESLESSSPPERPEAPYFVFRHQHGQTRLRVTTNIGPGADPLEYRVERITQLDHQTSALRQLRGPNYPELTYVGEQFEKIAFFRSINFGPYGPLRKPQAADLPEHFLDEDASNLSLVINDLEQQASFRALLVERLKLFIEDVTDITTKVRGGSVQIFLHQAGLQRPIPASRLSDGTLRYLCLLAILCHPDPPPLVCIEEPELGMHPDVIRSIAELLIEASTRTQLIVTTHSDLLVSALSEILESVIICEHDKNGSTLRRLESERLKVWLERYSLGDLWLKGEIGGTRW